MSVSAIHNAQQQLICKTPCEHNPQIPPLQQNVFATREAAWCSSSMGKAYD